MIPIFICAGNKMLNIHELMYINKAKTKNVYIAAFKSGVDISMPYAQGQKHDNNVVFLSPLEYKDFQKNLADFYANAPKQTNPQV